ncbi:hypothetical protein A3A03_02880 [Candidatus Nomurabacteria bacterium RIFCSPLOWO2_01_FULL_40_18]|uniref:Nucleotide-diphospho-sugar transferase domain-containing protein n=1 Tax=Candidatus Nomurabacteria bacterium RIFCSPLOWO2_01_FULL_40_18 TaxID=1801773 RepID=A0A1F6XK09_9BACT|nr:MAG: hypothetical protein A3A03_02880 [Candidatus Nomurabacteria bacterium RIFCSPLOWO2_01_FULL_40_18]
MKQFAFLTMGDRTFFHSICYSIWNINRLYPTTLIYVYDWGFTDFQKKYLESGKNTVLIPWNKRFVDISISFSSWREKLSLVHGMRGWKDFLPYIRKPRMIFDNQDYAKFLKREMLFVNKVLCMQDYLKNHGNNFIFLDGDAVVVQCIDELLNDSFDIGVTLRESNEIVILPKSCSVLNVGVLFFLGGNIKNTLFIDYWMERIYNTHERFIEQSALTQLLFESNTNIFENYKEVIIHISREDFRVKVLPCRVYNHYRAKKYGVTKENKIVHFKSLNYRKEVFYKFLEELGLPIPAEIEVIRQEYL